MRVSQSGDYGVICAFLNRLDLPVEVKACVALIMKAKLCNVEMKYIAIPLENNFNQ